ncbi:MAG TPA: hypothetical protein VFH23_14350 [Jiangellaceae bacterium]|nr:hypothetical protein [Jiangellaceae bacterium]
MRTGFARPEIADYRSNGFLSVPDGLTVAELAHWREVVDAAMAARPPSAVRTQQREGVHLADASTPGLDAVGQLVEDQRLGHLEIAARASCGSGIIQPPLHAVAAGSILLHGHLASDFVFSDFCGDALVGVCGIGFRSILMRHRSQIGQPLASAQV